MPSTTEVSAPLHTGTNPSPTGCGIRHRMRATPRRGRPRPDPDNRNKQGAVTRQGKQTASVHALSDAALIHSCPHASPVAVAFVFLPACLCGHRLYRSKCALRFGPLSNSHHTVLVQRHARLQPSSQTDKPVPLDSFRALYAWAPASVTEIVVRVDWSGLRSSGDEAMICASSDEGCMSSQRKINRINPRPPPPVAPE